MKIKKLGLQNFRNIKKITLECDSKINFLVGKNAQGKTSLLEAIHYLSTLRSFRSHKLNDFIKHDENQSELFCEISSEVYGDNLKTQLKVLFERDVSDKEKFKKIAYINGKGYKSVSHYLSEKFNHPLFGFHAIVFNPSDHDLVRGDPKGRRMALNTMISSQDADYLNLIKKFERVLLQRNALLKAKEFGGKYSEELFNEYTEQFLHYSSIITHKRLNWLHELNGLYNDVAEEICPIKKAGNNYNFGYQSEWLFKEERVKFTGQFECPSIQIIDGKLRDFLSANRAREHRYLSTLAGPHKDDFLFFLRDRPLKSVGSQGEVRTALLAFKLSEVKLYENKTNALPLFLLDDFSSELDEERRNLLLEKLLEMNVQTFVTTTDQYFLRKEYPSYFIQDGSFVDLSLIQKEKSGELIL